MIALIGYYKKTLLHFFAELHRLENDPEDFQLCLEIQEMLISKITYVEGRIRKLRARIKVSKRILATPHSQLDKNQALITKGQIKQLEASVNDYKSLLHTFRCIGDGLAFIYIDRFDIKPMSFKEDPGFISQKKGNKLERKILRYIFKNGGLAILNDLTHSLRYGDLFVQTETERFLLEVKSGRHEDGRAKRQVHELDAMLGYLNSQDNHGFTVGDFSLARKALFTTLRDLHEEINLVIQQAIANGHGSKKAESGLYYYAETSSQSGKLSDELMQIITSLPKPPTVAFLNRDKYLTNAYYPLVLSITDPLALYKFYEGSLLLFVIIDPVAITDFFFTHGVIVKFTPADTWVLKFEGASNGIDKFRVGSHLFGRIVHEFLSLEWVLDECLQFYQRGHQSLLVDVAESKPLPNRVVSLSNLLEDS